MADLILIPVVLLFLYKIEYKKDGIYEDYLDVERCNILRGGMAIVVVLFHIGLYVNENILKICQGPDAVKIFFFLSGFGLILSLKNKPNYLKGFLSKRLAKIIIPLILPTISFFFLYKYVICSYYTKAVFSFKSVITEFINHGYPFIYNSWYIIVLIVLYLIFYVSFLISKSDLQKGTMVATAITCVFMLSMFGLSVKKGWISDYSMSTFAFLFGLYFGLYKNKIDKFLARHYSKISFVLVLALTITVMLSLSIYYSMGSNLFYVMFKNLVLGPFIVIGVVLAGAKIKLNNPFWKYVGNISYDLYLVHAICYILLRSKFINVENDFLFVLATLVSSLILASAFHAINNCIIKLYFKLLNKSKAR